MSSSETYYERVIMFVSEFWTKALGKVMYVHVNAHPGSGVFPWNVGVPVFFPAGGDPLTLVQSKTCL